MHLRLSEFLYKQLPFINCMFYKKPLLSVALSRLFIVPLMLTNANRHQDHVWSLAKNPATLTLAPLLTEAAIPNGRSCRKEAKGVTSEMARTRSETFLLHSLHWRCTRSCFPSNTNLILPRTCRFVSYRVCPCHLLPWAGSLWWQGPYPVYCCGPGPHLRCLIGNRLLKNLSNKKRMDGRKGDIYGILPFTVLPGMLLTLYLLLLEKNNPAKWKESLDSECCADILCRS